MTPPVAGQSLGGGLTAMGILGTILVGGLVWRSMRSRRDRTARAAQLSSQFDADAARRTSASLAVLQLRDPKLTEESIEARVRVMSDRVRDAWCARDMRPARAFVSDGVLSRFQVQLELMTSEGVRNVMSDARVLYVSIEAVSSNAPVDAVHVRLTAEARDTTVPESATEAQISAALASQELVPYTEIWTLVRKQGALSVLDAFQIGHACPSCGAPLDPGGETLKCKYCSALLGSGEHDWVLSEITQLEEWRTDSASPPPGLERLREVDLGAARESIEDRASHLFWTWVRATLSENPAAFWDVAVGGAELLFVDVAAAEPTDLAFVQVFWSARDGEADEAVPRQNVLRLSRATGVSTAFSMTALVCMTCGAPLSESAVSACDRCKSPVAPRAHTWTLDGVFEVGAPQICARHAEGPTGSGPAALIPDVSDPRACAALFAEMARMVAIDGHIDRDEKRLLTACGARWAIPEAVVARALAGTYRPTSREASAAHADWLLGGLVAAALADGRIDAREMQLLRDTCARLSLPDGSVDDKIAQYKSRLGIDQASGQAGS